MPGGANAVVMVEDTDLLDNQIEVRSSVVPSENVLHSGTDIASGDLIVRRGKKLTPMELAKLAACGSEKVEVYKGAKVGIISTGPELVPPGESLAPSRIYDINSSLLYAGVEESGGIPKLLGIVHDDRDQLKKVFKKSARSCDLLLTSGSTSAGPHDMVYSILEEEGQILAHGVKIKPGKPTALGLINGIPVFGLPGNPSSAYVIFMNFVAPLLRKLAGRLEATRPTEQAVLVEKTKSEGGRLEQKFVGLVKREGKTKAYPINKVSGAITLLSQADGFVQIPEGVTYLQRNEEVNVSLLSQEPSTPELLVIGSNCKGVHQLINHFDFQVRYLSRGSMGGIRAIENLVADVAGIHIWTPQSYNVPFLREREIDDVILLRGYTREQGLILPPDNPRSVSSMRDLIEKDLTMVNRTGGSGTRILFDNKLEEVAGGLGLDFTEVTESLAGYEVELSTHSAVATAVSSGKADVGMGIKTVAAGMGLGFVKLQEERFDLLCQKSFLKSLYGDRLQETLKSSEFQRDLQKLPGLIPGKDMGKVIYST